MHGGLVAGGHLPIGSFWGSSLSLREHSASGTFERDWRGSPVDAFPAGILMRTWRSSGCVDPAMSGSQASLTSSPELQTKKTRLKPKVLTNPAQATKQDRRLEIASRILFTFEMNNGTLLFLLLILLILLLLFERRPNPPHVGVYVNMKVMVGRVSLYGVRDSSRQ